MKKLILILICATFISQKGFSQSTAKKIMDRLEFGIKGGFNYSDFTDANFDTDPLEGFNGGLTVAFKINKNLLIQQDFLYSTAGAKVLNGPLGAQKIKLSYVNVPILIKYRTNFGLYLEAGPQVSLKIDEEVANFNGTDFAKKIDFGLAGGIGFQSKIGLGIGARYVYGMEKVLDVPIANVTPDFKNNNIQASLFFVF